MIGFQTRTFLCTDDTDMRKPFGSLVGIIQSSIPLDLDRSAELPDNVQNCHKLIKDLFTRIAELEKQISRRNRAAFGQKSARVNSASLTGTGKTIHATTQDELANEKQRLNIVPVRCNYFVGD